MRWLVCLTATASLLVSGCLHREKVIATDSELSNTPFVLRGERHWPFEASVLDLCFEPTAEYHRQASSSETGRWHFANQQNEPIKITLTYPREGGLVLIEPRRFYLNRNLSCFHINDRHVAKTQLELRANPPLRVSKIYWYWYFFT
jgi:hypothetical protein